MPPSLRSADRRASSGCQSRPDVVFDVHLQMAGQLLVELALPAATVEEGGRAQPERPQASHDEAFAVKKRARMAVVCCHARASLSTCARPARVSR